VKSYPYQTKTNVAPLIDVSLIIVLALMVMAPHLNPATHGVDLPPARAAEVSDSDRTEITCTLDGAVFVGEEQIPLDELRAYLTPFFAENPNTIAVVKADRGMMYGDVERVLEEVEGAKAPRVALATRQPEQQEVAAR
jgi:biopolymer transport protein ExbD